MQSMAPLYFSVLASNLRNQQQRTALLEAKNLSERQENREDNKAAASYITRMAETQVEQAKLEERKAMARAENDAFLASMLGDQGGMDKVHTTREQRMGHERGMAKGTLKSKQLKASSEQQAFENMMKRGGLEVSANRAAGALEHQRGQRVLGSERNDLLHERNLIQKNQGWARISNVRDYTQKHMADSVAKGLISEASGLLQKSKAMLSGAGGFVPANKDAAMDLEKRAMEKFRQARAALSRIYDDPSMFGTPEAMIDYASRPSAFERPPPSVSTGFSNEGLPPAASGEVTEPTILDTITGMPGKAYDSFTDDPFSPENILKDIPE